MSSETTNFYSVLYLSVRYVSNAFSWGLEFYRLCAPTNGVKKLNFPAILPPPHVYGNEFSLYFSTNTCCAHVLFSRLFHKHVLCACLTFPAFFSTNTCPAHVCLFRHFSSNTCPALVWFPAIISTSTCCADLWLFPPFFHEWEGKGVATCTGKLLQLIRH